MAELLKLGQALPGLLRGVVDAPVDFLVLQRLVESLQQAQLSWRPVMDSDMGVRGERQGVEGQCIGAVVGDDTVRGRGCGNARSS